VKQIRKRLTYANVMSSIAVFLILGGATAFAATKIGAGQLKANSVKTGKIVKEAVTEGKIKNGAITTNKLADGSVTNIKLADKAVTGAKIDTTTLGPVPTATSAANAANAEKLGGVLASGYERRAMWATVSAATDDIVTQTGGISVVGHFAGGYYLLFPEDVTGKSIVATPISSTLGSPGGTVDLKVAACGNAPESAFCAQGPNTNNEAFIATFAAGAQSDVAFYITVLP
jgi:hypothetical protein